jgi:hypothetical protein
MTTPSDPQREGEKIVAERTVETVATAEAVTVTEHDEVTVQPEHADFDRDRDPDTLNHHQRVILRQLTRLHRSLRGPQTMLETAGHFNRPPFPPPHRPPR